MALRNPSRYDVIIETIFRDFRTGTTKSFEFTRDQFAEIAGRLNVVLPKNLGDIVYTYRYRKELPESIQSTAPEGQEWTIRPAGIGKYRFELMKKIPISPSKNYVRTKIPDSTPGVIRKYSINDEQALLAVLRYNRLIDIFTGLTCYSLQNHLRTTVRGMGQVETDELYVGLDRRGAHYIIPVQAKGGTDRLGSVQIEQDFAMCAQKYANLICRPVAAQFMDDQGIALFEFQQTDEGVQIVEEKHYKLVEPDELTASDLAQYGQRNR